MQKREVKLLILALFWGTRATLPRDSHGQTQEREVKLHIFSNFSVSRATLTRVWRGQATEREVKLQLFGFPRGSRAHEAIERSDDKHRLEIHVESIESST